MGETTLFDTEQFGESRRVFCRANGGGLEVGESTSGPLTNEVYGSRTHYHAVRLSATATEEGARHLVACEDDAQDAELESLLVAYFAADERFLSDLMDDLDDWGVSYGYISGCARGVASYRSHSRADARRSALRLVD